MKSSLLIFVLFLSFFGVSQDSLKVLSYEDFMTQVMNHHPNAFRADLITKQGDAYLLKAKGYTDPKLFADINQKYFSDKQYYSYFSGGVKVPTWFGVSFESGYNLNDGTYINPERQLPESGLVYAGIKLDLGNGLIMNERRAMLKQGKIAQASSEIERAVFLNQLHFDATEAYLKWNAAYRKYQVYQSAVLNSEIRLQAVRSSAEFGDRPYIDTTEATITLESRKIAMNQALTDYLNAEEALEMYLWSNGTVPIEIENITPMTPDESEIFKGSLLATDSLLYNHPFLKIQAYKLDINTIDLALKKERLKPDLSLKYNLLNEPVGNNPLSNLSPYNYQWGASFNYAFITRKERGDVRLASIKLEDQRLAFGLKQQELEYKIEVAKNNLDIASKQLNLTTSMRNNSEKLFQAEQKMFEIGESSVFMINSRENSFLKAEMDLINANQQLLHSINEINYYSQTNN